MAIKTHIQELAEKIEKDISLNKEDNTITDETSFEKHIPEGLDIETINNSNGYQSDFVAASSLATGRVAIKEMAKGKMDTVTAHFKMAKDSHVDHTVNRSKDYKNPQNPDQVITNWGDNSSVFTIGAGKNAGQIKAARTEIKELAKEALSK